MYKPLIWLFDFETTGLPHQGARVVPVQVAVAVIDPNQPGWPEIGCYHSYIQIPPDATLGTFAMAMHRKKGRNQQFYQKNGKPAAQVYEELEAFAQPFLTKYSEKPRKLLPAGHNVGPFDIPLLRREAYLHGVDVETFLDHHCLDTAGMAYERYMFDRPILEKVSLKPLCQHLGIELDEEKDQHDAVVDVLKTAEVLRKLMMRPVYEHYQNGSHYTKLAEGTSNDVIDHGADVVVYRAEDTGNVYVRTADNFNGNIPMGNLPAKPRFKPL